jgi:hypothetical protein
MIGTRVPWHPRWVPLRSQSKSSQDCVFATVIRRSVLLLLMSFAPVLTVWIVRFLSVDRFGIIFGRQLAFCFAAPRLSISLPGVLWNLSCSEANISAMRFTAPEVNSLPDLPIEKLRDLYSAEMQFVGALPGFPIRGKRACPSSDRPGCDSQDPSKRS